MSEGDTALTAEERAKIDALHDVATNSTYFELLGVPPEADPRQVQKAYYDLSRSWHPDRFFRREMGEYGERLEMVFATITKAYRTLSDETARTRYTRELEESGIDITALTADLAADEATEDLSSGAPVHEADLSGLRRNAAQRADAKREADARRAAAVKRLEEARKKRSQSKMVQQLRETMKDRMSRGHRYFLTGKEDFEAGRFVKAAGALHLAVQFDPKNAEYKRLYDEATEKARGAQVASFVEQAHKADQNYNPKAMVHYLKRACEYDPDDASVYFRTAVAIREKEEDNRGALVYLRKAVDKDPKNTGYRIALAELYELLTMNLNARREYQTVLAQDPKNETAKKAIKRLR